MLYWPADCSPEYWRQENITWCEEEEISKILSPAAYNIEGHPRDTLIDRLMETE